jgi:CheY-like chemotaxis protein
MAFELTKPNGKKTPQNSQAGADKGFGPKLILIVDNSPYSARITSKLLQSWGYICEVAHSPAAALAMLSNGEVFPDLLFVEMLYHRENVFSFPKQVHSNPLWRNLPIVAHSVRTTRQNVVRAIQSGYCDYILRPTEPDILKDKLEKLFSNSTQINSSTFALPIRTVASIGSDIEITAINELGIEGYSRSPLALNSVVTANSPFLDQFHLNHAQVRVMGCEEDLGSIPPKYKVAMTFIGLSSESATLIRQYLIRESKKVLKTAA